MPVKDSLNEENDYNRCAQNFQGRFCTCRQPYDGTTNGDMMQCIVCEDWFHLHCLQLTGEEQVMVEDKQVEVEAEIEVGAEEVNHDDPIDTISKDEVGSEDEEATLICSDCVSKYPLLGSLNRTSSQGCLDPTATQSGGALVLPAGWRRTRLCKCEACQGLLRTAGLQYLAQSEPLYEPEPDHIPGSSYEGSSCETRLRA